MKPLKMLLNEEFLAIWGKGLCYIKNEGTKIIYAV